MNLLSRTEAAKYLQMGTTKLDSLRREGKLEYYRDGGRVLFSKDDLDRYRNSCKVVKPVCAEPWGTYRKKRASRAVV